MLKTTKWLPPLLALAFAGTALAQTAEPGQVLQTGIRGEGSGRRKSHQLAIFRHDAGRPRRRAGETPSATIRAGGRVPVTTAQQTRASSTWA